VTKLARGAMGDDRADVRQAAIELLRHTDRDAATVTVSALVAVLNDGAVEVRREAISTLEWLGPDAVPAVGKLVEVMLDDGDETVRRSAVCAVLRIDRGGKRACRRLAKIEGVNKRGEWSLLFSAFTRPSRRS
jgi:HEAT repeat protein